jgi:hypothetical protein
LIFIEGKRICSYQTSEGSFIVRACALHGPGPVVAKMGYLLVEKWGRRRLSKYLLGHAAWACRSSLRFVGLALVQITVA